MDSDSSGASADYTREDAKLLLDQITYLLDDEKTLADKLVQDRKLKLSLMLALLIGLGLFNYDAYKGALEVAWDSHRVLVVFLTLSVACLVVVSLALWWLVWEDDPEVLKGLLKDIRSDGEGSSAGDQSTDGSDGEDNPKEQFGAALVGLYPSNELVEQVASSGWEDVANRIEDKKSAYYRLAIANRKVRRRLEKGTFALLLSLFSVIILSGYGLYLTINAERHQPSHGKEVSCESCD